MNTREIKLNSYYNTMREFQTSVSNIGRVKCECGKLAVEHVSEIRSCYAELKRQYEMEVC